LLKVGWKAAESSKLLFEVTPSFDLMVARSSGQCVLRGRSEHFQKRFWTLSTRRFTDFEQKEMELGLPQSSMQGKTQQRR